MSVGANPPSDLEEMRDEIQILAAAMSSGSKLMLDVDLIAAGYRSKERDAIKWLVNNLVHVATGGIVHSSYVDEHPFARVALVSVADAKPTDLAGVVRILAEAIGVHPRVAFRYVRLDAESGRMKDGHRSLGTLDADALTFETDAIEQADKLGRDGQTSSNG